MQMKPKLVMQENWPHCMNNKFRKFLLEPVMEMAIEEMWKFIKMKINVISMSR